MGDRRTTAFVVRIAILSGLLMACSGPATQTKTEKDETGVTLTANDDLKDPKGEPPKVVYTAKASDESERRIDAAVDTAIEGNLQRAIDDLKSVLDDDDQAFLAAHNLGVLHEDIGQDSSARTYYEKALGIEPDFSPSVLNLVRLEGRTNGNPVSLADRYVNERPNNLEHKVARLEALALVGRSDDVITSAREVLRVDEAHLRARYYLALAHYTAKRYPLALYILDEALKVGDYDPEMHFLRGLTLVELEDEVTARAAFERAVSLRPDYPEAQNALGLQFYRDRDWAEAENAFNTAILYAPDFKEAFLNLGNALKAQNRGDEAEAAYKRVLELDSKWGDAHFSLGALYLANELIALKSINGMPRLEAAKAEFQTAKDLWSDAETDELADQFLAKSDKAIEIMIAEEELRQLEQGGGDGGDGGGDPFGEDDGDPFGDETDGGGGADPFADEDAADPEPESTEGGGADPFEDGDDK